MTQARDLVRERVLQEVASGLHLGRLHPGDRLGSARRTARETGTDYRLVVAALRGLEREGLVEIRPRGGLYVGHRQRRGGDDAAVVFEEHLAEFVARELAGGWTLAAMAARLGRCLGTVGVRAACVECNDDQLDFLCRELQGSFGVASVGIEIDRLRGGAPLALRDASFLVTTTFHAGDVGRWARRLGKPCVVATLDPQRRADVGRLLRERPVVFVGTDPRWATKARRIWGSEPGAENLVVLTLGHDSLAGIADDAAVMLMPKARRLLGSSELVRRALPARGLSSESKLQILAALIHANLGAMTAGGR